MPAKHTFLLVEGRHDAEFIARLLAIKGFRQKKHLREIPEELIRLIPRNYPAEESIPLTEPQRVPNFYQFQENWVSILVGGGATAAVTLGNAVREGGIRGFYPHGIGVFIDQDQHATTAAAQAAFQVEFAKQEDLPRGLVFNRQPGTVHPGPPQVGLFVLPDNQQRGALEDVLLECGEVIYPALKKQAEAYAHAAWNQCGLTTDDLRTEYGQSGGQKDISKRKKAIVGVMGGILKPAAAIQNSIRENRWLEGAALELPRVKDIQRFLDELIG